MHRMNSNERVMKDLAYMLGTLRKLGVFDRSIILSMFDLREIVIRWKMKIFNVGAREISR